MNVSSGHKVGEVFYLPDLRRKAEEMIGHLAESQLICLPLPRTALQQQQQQQQQQQRQQQQQQQQLVVSQTPYDLTSL
jgi:hypothetical protein